MELYQHVAAAGSGSYGLCEVVRNVLSKKLFVKKTVDFRYMIGKEKEQLVSEVNLLRKLKHPNIVRYHDRIVDKRGFLNIIMEYCCKGDLEKYINEKKELNKCFSERYIWRVICQLTSAVKLCHSRCDNERGKVILHRDIKPANIFLNEKFDVKLGDFGFAKTLSNTGQYAITMIGTPCYMSPELIKMKPYNNRSDVWSLGCLLYEICTLEHPFYNCNHTTMNKRIIEGAYKKISRNFETDLDRLISFMLNPDDTKRPDINKVEQYILNTCPDITAIKYLNHQTKENVKSDELLDRERLLNKREEMLNGDEFEK